MACLRGFELPTFGSDCHKTHIVFGPFFRDEVPQSTGKNLLTLIFKSHIFRSKEE